MPIVECKAAYKHDNKKSIVVTTILTRSPEPLVIPKSICKILELKHRHIDGFDMLRVDVPQWLLSKWVKEFNLDDYECKILI